MVFSFIIISTATIQYIKVPEVLSWIVDSSSRILLEHSFQFLQSRKIVVEEITFKEVLPAASWAKASRFYQMVVSPVTSTPVWVMSTCLKQCEVFQSSGRVLKNFLKGSKESFATGGRGGPRDGWDELWPDWSYLSQEGLIMNWFTQIDNDIFFCVGICLCHLNTKVRPCKNSLRFLGGIWKKESLPLGRSQPSQQSGPHHSVST